MIIWGIIIIMEQYNSEQVIGQCEFSNSKRWYQMASIYRLHNWPLELANL